MLFISYSHAFQTTMINSLPATGAAALKSLRSFAISITKVFRDHFSSPPQLLSEAPDKRFRRPLLNPKKHRFFARETFLRNASLFFGLDL